MTITDHYLEQLENEAIYILRETAAQFEKPALLFSGGKDSIVLVHLALKAFRPGKFPFPLVHIDTGHNFPEAIDFNNRLKFGEGLEEPATTPPPAVKKPAAKPPVKKKTGGN